MLNYFRYLKNKELFIALYFLFFIFGYLVGVSDNFYNEFRILEIIVLLILFFIGVVRNKKISIVVDILFFSYLSIGCFFWVHPEFVVIELLTFYLLYNALLVIDYNVLITKIILWSSFYIFLLLPISIFSYLHIGVYRNWYPMPWNIRIYDSYFLVLSIFSIWFYLTEKKYRYIYLTFIFLAFLSILLDVGRSATIAYTLFISVVCWYYKNSRLQLASVYLITWAVYFLIIAFTPLTALGSIIRGTTSGRYNLWLHAVHCWVKSPLIGCGFYQLDQYPNSPAHPHNLFLQILSEIGLIGLCLLGYLIFFMIRGIKFKNKKFILAALLAVSVDVSFSGIHIYPITQLLLLWLFAFFIKNPEFRSSSDFYVNYNKRKILIMGINLFLYVIIAIVFLFLFKNTSFLSESLPLSPPRFWEYGYKLF